MILTMRTEFGRMVITCKTENKRWLFFLPVPLLTYKWPECVVSTCDFPLQVYHWLMALGLFFYMAITKPARRLKYA